jgi:hypothetical protein
VKKRRPCPCCGTSFQTGRIVYRMLPDGPARQRVCQPCASLAVLVLASDTPARCEVCAKQLARFCGGCVATLISKATGKGVAELAAGARKHRKR